MKLIHGHFCPFPPLLSTLRARALGGRPTCWPLLCYQFASQALQFYGAGSRALEFPVFRSISAAGRHRCTHHSCLSDNLQRATGQCLRDIWPQQQQRRTGRLFSRSVTATERRFRWSLRSAACSRSPLLPAPTICRKSRLARRAPCQTMGGPVSLGMGSR